MRPQKPKVGSPPHASDHYSRKRYVSVEVVLRYLTLKEVFWYELPRTLRGLAVGARRLYLPSGVMNQVSDTKKRVVKA